MELNTRKKPVVIDELPFGVYVWQMPDGRWVGDEDGNFLNIAAMKGDKKRLAQLADAARAHGIEEGMPFFLSGHRQVDDEEYESQRQRMQWGLIPDPLDIAAINDEIKHGHH